MISTYILCGFGSVAALGMNLGALSSAAPERRAEFAGLMLRSMINGNIACFMTACIAGTLSRVMRKPDFYILCKNKDVNQLRSNCAADQRLCFRFIDSTISLLSKFEISSFYPSSMAAQPGLCRSLSEKNPKTGIFITRLISFACFMKALLFY